MLKRSSLFIEAATALAIVAGSVTQNIATSAEPGGNHYLSFWRSYFQGEWATKIVAGEEKGRDSTGTEGTWSCHLSPTKMCMLFSATTKGRPDYSAVAGYDPKSKAWKEVFFFGDGSHLIQFYRATPDELAGQPAGKVIKGEAEYIYADGRIETADIQVDIVDANKCQFSATNRHIGEQGLTDLKFIFDRKKN